MKTCLQVEPPAALSSEKHCALAPNAMLKCLMLLPEFPPKNTAGVHRSLRFCQFLPEFGWHALVLASNVSEPGGDRLLNKIPPKTVVTRIGPVVAAATSTGNPSAQVSRRPAVYAALRRMLSPAMQLMTETPDRNISWSRLAQKKGSEYLRSNSIDVLYSSGPPHSVHLAARKLAVEFGIPWIADFRDPWARKPWTKKANPWGQYLLPLFERTVVQHATKVVLNTEASCQDFCAAYPKHSDKFHCIPNGLDPELVDRVREISAAKTTNNSIAVLCHPGSMYGHRDPAPVLRAIARLHAEGLSIRLQQIGPVAEQFRPQAVARELGISHLFEEIPSLSHNETLQKMSQADVLLIIQPDAPLMVPSKAYEMLAFDQPLLAVCDSAGTEAVVREAGGFTAPSRDEPQIASALRNAWLARSDVDRLHLRKSARLKYDGRQLTEKLAQVLTEAVHIAASPHHFKDKQSG